MTALVSTVWELQHVLWATRKKQNHKGLHQCHSSQDIMNCIHGGDFSVDTSQDFWISSVYLEEGVVLFWLLVRSLFFLSTILTFVVQRFPKLFQWIDHYLWITAWGKWCYFLFLFELSLCRNFTFIFLETSSVSASVRSPELIVTGSRFTSVHRIFNYVDALGAWLTSGCYSEPVYMWTLSVSCAVSIYIRIMS